MSEETAVEIHDGRCLFRGDGDEPCARHRSGYPARLAESRPSDALAAARFVATHWRDAYLEQHRTDPSGQWAIGTHPLSLVLAALDGERDPVHLGLPAEVHGAFRAALAEADPAAPGKPTMSDAMSDADEGPA
jgi:hypothetical protein